MDKSQKPAAIKIHQLNQKILITVYLRNKDSSTGKAMIQAFEQVYKKHSDTLSVSIQMTILNDDHTEPHICVTNSKTGEILSQIFNFLDFIGGKSAVTAENIEKILIMRGIVSYDGDQILKTQKEQEAFQFVTESSHFAGEAYQLDLVELKQLTDYVQELDTINILQLEPTNFKYADALTQVLRDCEDPFKRDIANLVFSQNPAEPTKLIKALDLFTDKHQSN